VEFNILSGHASHALLTHLRYNTLKQLDQRKERPMTQEELHQYQAVTCALQLIGTSRNKLIQKLNDTNWTSEAERELIKAILLFVYGEKRD
jgi:hypothetical protein